MKEADLYNSIPEYVFEKRFPAILEIGVYKGEHQLNSKYSQFFLDNYLGIDVELHKSNILNVVQADILTYEIDKKFDIILCIATLQYINYCDWEKVIDKLISYLNVDGYLVIIVNYKQKITDVYPFRPIYEEKNNHNVKTFYITKKAIRRILPGAKLKVLHSSSFRKGIVLNLKLFFKRRIHYRALMAIYKHDKLKACHRSILKKFFVNEDIFSMLDYFQFSEGLI
jgi:hypothetical protein